MRGRLHLHFFCVVAAIATLSCQDDPTVPNSSYPTTLSPLSANALEALRSVFLAKNPGDCSALDDYGMTSWHVPFSPCQPNSRVDCTDVDRLIAQAESELKRNRLFTGVTESDPLRIRRSSCDPDSFAYSSLHLRYENQEYEGLEVLGTQILVHMDQNGVYWIVGHHYPVISVPSPLVSADAAKESILGLKITWHDFGGAPHDYVVTEDSLDGDAQRVIFPYTLGNRIELRVPWGIPVERSSWIVYVDSVTGEQIGVTQLFRT